MLPNAPVGQGSEVPIFVIDWEMCQLGAPALDMGQMIAEMYELALFKDIQAGVWLVQGLTAGYGEVGDSFAFRTAIHVGTHLVTFGSSVREWGTPEQVQEVVRTGKDITVNAWQRNRDWFSGHPLECLFNRT